MHVNVWVKNLSKENAQRFESVAAGIAGVTAVETWRGRAEIAVEDATAIPTLVAALRTEGFEIRNDEPAPAVETPKPQDSVRRVYVDGMTCRSCEITIERKFKKIRGVRSVNADAARGVVKIVCEEGCVPAQRQLQRAIQNHGYTVRDIAEASASLHEKPSLLRLIGLFAAVFILGSLLTKLGFLKQGYTIGGSTNFLSALLIGLAAGSSSCIAVSGGLLLSSTAKYRERYGAATTMERIRPTLLFVAGRVLSYGFFGGLIGLIGRAMTPSPFMTGAITLFAAIVMLIMGLDMLKLAPPWLKALLPRMPKSLSHRIMDAEGKESPAMPMLLGAGTFFLPCGFTQALQLYALTIGSFWAGALVLAGFALGTAPALLALGWASTSLKGNLGKLFFQFSGAFVIVLGLWNVQNGFTIAGYPLRLPSFGSGESAIAAGSQAEEPLPPIVGDKQVIKMDVGGPNAAYDPDNFTVKAGKPVRFEVNGVEVGGCISVLQSRSLGFSRLLQPGPNVIEFTPQKTGTHTFSCSMGMFRGTINVIP